MPTVPAIFAAYAVILAEEIVDVIVAAITQRGGYPVAFPQPWSHASSQGCNRESLARIGL